MSNEKDKELDDFFRKGLEDPVGNTGYMDDDWDKMEQLLDKKKKRGIIVYWLPILSSVAALLLIFLGWLALRPKVTPAGQNHLQAVAKIKKSDPGINSGVIKQQEQAPHQQIIPPATTYIANTNKGNTNKENNNSSNSTNKGKQFFASSSAGSQRDTTAESKITMPARQSDESLIAYSASSAIEQGVLSAEAINLSNSIIPYVKTALPQNNKIKITRQPAFHPQYALSVLAAPDANGVGSFGQSKLGTNVGLGFSAGISKKFTVSTGVLYSVKPYITGFSNYHTAFQFSEDPVNVTADCRMLDIPLNIGYQLYNKHQNKISVGTGLSSYVMLHENYKFNYADSYATGPASYTVPHSGKYFFGVANLNAAYQRQLNEKMGISVQPYLKLPLTDIGYSQVRLQTTGVAVGITWNLNSLSKP